MSDVVVVCLWKELGDSNFQFFFFTKLPVPPQAAGVIGTFLCTFYTIMSARMEKRKGKLV